MARDKSFLHNAKPAKKRPPRSVFGALDIETVKSEHQIPGTSALGGSIAILTYAYEEILIKTYKKSGKINRESAQKREIVEGYVKNWADFFEMLHEIPKLRKVTWFAHNMEFDFARAVDDVKKLLDSGYVLKPIINGLGRFITVKIYDDKEELFFSLRDSAAVIAGSLEEITEILAPEYKKLTGAIDWEHEQFDINNKLHLQYAIRDPRGLLESMITLEKMLIEHFGAVLKLTAASVSMQAFRVTLDKNDFYCRDEKISRNYQRQGYYGGYVFCGYKTGFNIDGPLYHYDFSSCYPFCMRSFGVPAGRNAVTYGYCKGDIGIYRVKVTVKDHDLPIVPLRSKNGVYWPRGTFETVLTSVDIESCFNHGISVKVIEGIQFEKIAFPFKKIIDKCEYLRKTYKGSPLEMMAKLIQNSLYGKFASRENLTETIYSASELEGFNSFCVGDMDLADWNILENYKQTKSKELDEDYLLIAWSCFITANARKHLHACMKIAGYGNVYYTDTDSLVDNEVGSARLNNAGKIAEKINSNYGDLILEKTYINFKVIAPKVYVGLTIGGEYVGKAKGIPKKIRGQELYTSILNGNEQGKSYTFESVSSLKSVLNGNDFSTIRERKLSTFENCAGWVNEGDKVLSVHVDDVKNIIEIISPDF